MGFSIFLSPSATQFFLTLDKPLQKALSKCFTAISSHTRPPNIKTLDQKAHLYRVREGIYRAIYTIRNNELIVLSIKQSIPRPPLALKS